MKAGEGPYSRNSPANRWGDYSASVVDPANDADLWTTQEYAAEPVGDPEEIGSGRYGTWWGKIKVDVPLNDSFGSAIVLSSIQGITNGTAIRAMREAGEPAHADGSDAAAVWYSWTAPASGDVTFVLTNLSSWFDTVLGVYTGNAISNLVLVTNHHGGFSRSSVVFHAASNTTYRIAIAGYSGIGGDFSLFWKQPTIPLFTKQPETTNVVTGENVTFSAAAIGEPQPLYQWRLEGTNLPAATNASHTIASVQANHMTNYTVVVSNSIGTATSTVAALYVHTSGTAKLSDWQATSAQFTMTISGVTNRPYVVEATTNSSSTNFTGWLPIFTNYVTFNFTNQITTNFFHRLFRAVYQ